MAIKIIKNPVARKRIARFKEQRTAYAAFWILLVLYILSLGSELICNSSPLYVRYNGESFYPVLKFYPEDTFLNNGKKTRPDYKTINALPRFKDDPANYMVFPLLRSGPFESVSMESLNAGDMVDVALSPVTRLGTVNIRQDFTIARSSSFGAFAKMDEFKVRGSNFRELFDVSGGLVKAVTQRFDNRDSDAFEWKTTSPDGSRVVVSMREYKQRSRAPKTVRLRIMEEENTTIGVTRITFNEQRAIDGKPPKIWAQIDEHDRLQIVTMVGKRYTMPVDPYRLIIGETHYSATFKKEDIRFPFKPVKGHILGIDSAGRDVLARILYGLRISLTFGLLLVGASMFLGVAAGAVQGYFGGFTDITAQRFIEIWSALPFLYIMILMGSVYGRSFSLLLVCYGIFNWIGISYYIRAEFLRLRKQSFVESAKCMGIPAHRIIFKHIMPNAMIPVITFFPFSLVGAIGSLAALDYLGFGLPPPTPSWGELLFQAQQYRWAWWLILYPSLALFIVMLLGVFVGEGIRNAYDPKRYTRLE